MSNTVDTIIDTSTVDTSTVDKEEDQMKRTESQFFGSHLRNEIERDKRDLVFKNRLANPTKTPLKQIMSDGFTHYRTEPVIIGGEIDGCTARFEYRDWQKYSCFFNLSVQLEVAYGSFESAIRSTDVRFSFDNREVLSFSGSNLYHALVLTPTQYEETKRVYERTKILNIPLQYLICEKTYLPAGDIEVEVIFNNFEFGDRIYGAELSLIGITTDASQGKKYMYLGQETMIKSYHFHRAVKSVLPIDMQVGVFKVLATPSDGKNYTDTLKIGDAKLVRTDSMFNRVNRYVRDIPNSYFYASRETPGSLDNAYTVHGLCYAHEGETKITIESDIPYDVCIVFQNAIGTEGHKSNGERTCQSKYSPIVDNYTPQPGSPIVDNYTPQPGTPFYRVSDTECIEGYWAPTKRMYVDDAWKLYNYPIVTSEPVDTEFLSKLNSILERLEPMRYFGCSNCRVCGQNNGSTEYRIEKDGTTFRMPEGMTHYYVDHNVHPSPEFREFVMNY